MIDTNSEAFKAVNSLLSATMTANLLRHTSLDDDARKAIPAQMEALTLELLKAYEAAKPVSAANIAAYNATIIHAAEAEIERLKAELEARPSEATMLNVLADIRMVTGLREQPMLSELAGEIGRLVKANEWRPIESAPRDGSDILLVAVDSDFPINDDDSDGFVTIGSWQEISSDTDGAWDFVGWHWSQDCWVKGNGTPAHWQPLPQLPREGV